MKVRVAGLALGLVFLTGCQNSPVGPVSNMAVPGTATLSADSCRSTLETYMKAIETNPDKYSEKNLAAYPEMVQYGKDLSSCQEKGFLTPQDMMKVAEKVDAETAPPEDTDTADAE
jgi:hypothetical protein